ncbi:transducin family protein / WD-40 repeat family protein [Zea mays]|uniref:Transducin family protein / WD-40 repeat family protein n=1 Tax=Zea mays TaxID=4577 RepID=A0A1D6IPA2_MAIZE|nr:transducin family protein / WD-40 repeat family protein [Zea mays]
MHSNYSFFFSNFGTLVWNLEFRQLFYSSQWDVNITAFAVIERTFMMYLGDENGLLSVLKYDVDDGKLQIMPYNVHIHSLIERSGVSLQDPQPIVGILIQPDTFGTRLLIAYERGLLVLWDVSEDRAVSVRGYGDLRMKGQINGAQGDSGEDQLNTTIDDSEEEREICSLCWASREGSTVAVGYITGDILLWDMTTKSSRQEKQSDVSSNVVKLQLASGSRRLPVIVLHWSAGSAVHSNKGGHLFVYGGDDMGSEEVLTVCLVLSLESTAGLESVRCMSRTDLKLDGSFADMILIPDTGVPDKSRTSALFILTNPGQLNFYDGGSLFSVQNSKEGTPLPEAQKFPVAIPTLDPNITVTGLYSLTESEFPNISLKKFCARKNAGHFISENMKWPLTGGVPNEMSLDEDHAVERIYIAGYQDGSVRIWDATFPVLMPMFVLDGNVADVNLDGANASVSSLAFCSLSMTLAVGTTSGLVRIYKLREHTGGSSFHFVSEFKQEVHVVHHGKGFHCYVAFLSANSSVLSLLFMASGGLLAAGYQNGQVAMLDPSQLSILFTVDGASGTNSPVVSLGIYSVAASAAKADQSKKDNPQNATLSRDVLLSLTKDARVTVLDCTTGVMINSHIIHQKQSSAISMYVIDAESDETQTQLSEDKIPSQGQTGKDGNDLDKIQTQGIEKHLKNASQLSQNGGSDSLLVVCCEDVLLLLSLASLIQGSSKHLQKTKLAKPCCWSAVFKNMDDKVCGLILAYQTGTIEMRFGPDLAIVAETSLMSLLRWSYKTGMEKSTSSSNGQVTLVNGSEFAIISLMASENDLRIPESLPCLHDKVLAAAAEAAMSFSTDQRRKQNPAAGIIGGFIKGMKGKAEENAKMRESLTLRAPSEQLESIFSKEPFAEPSIPDLDDPMEELSIDDIEIDDEVAVALAQAASSTSQGNKRTAVEEERAKLFEGSNSADKPRMRTQQEILTKYRFGGDAAAAAAHAKDKLMQRQEKLERISQQTAELQNGAENFASLAQELAKTMENKKWWKL